MSNQPVRWEQPASHSSSETGNRELEAPPPHPLLSTAAPVGQTAALIDFPATLLPSARLHPSYTQLRRRHFLSPMQGGRIIHSKYDVKQEAASQRAHSRSWTVRSSPVTTSARKHPDRRSGYLSLSQVRGGLMNCCLEQFVLPLLLIAVPEKRSEGSAARWSCVYC